MKKIGGVLLIVVGFMIIANQVPQFFSGNESSIQQTESRKGASDIKRVTVKSTAIPIDVIESDGEEVGAFLVGDNIDRFSINVSDQRGEWTVETEERQVFNLFSFFRSERPTLVVQVPATYSHSLSIETVSGDISFNSEFSLQDLSTKTVSGDVRLGKLSVTAFHFSSVSGDFHGSDLQTEETRGSTTSGNFEANGFTGALRLNTISGAIYVEFAEANSEGNVQTTSGDVRMIIPDPSLSLVTNTTTGSINVGHTLQDQSVNSRSLSGTIGDGQHSFTIKTTSGDISLN